MLGRTVTVVEIADHVSDGGNILHMQGLQGELEHHGVAVHLNTAVLEISAGGARCKTPEGDLRFDADTVVYATGQTSLSEEALAFRFAAPEFHMLGDCVAPKNIVSATGSAHSLALNIGRI